MNSTSIKSAPLCCQIAQASHICPEFQMSSSSQGKGVYIRVSSDATIYLINMRMKVYMKGVLTQYAHRSILKPRRLVFLL